VRSNVSLVFTAIASLAGGCAAHTSGKATEAALEEIRAPPPEGAPVLAERVGRETTAAALKVLASPEGLERISAIVDTTVTRSMDSALRAASDAGRTGGPGRSLVDSMARDSASAFGAALSLSLERELERELGPDGRGPLAASLGATASRVSGSAVQGARSELGALFAGCGTEDRQACLESEVRSLGRAASAGFVEGLAGSLAWPALGLAFVLGAAVIIVAQAAWGLLRRHAHPQRRQVHP
jgi:hypothetical protein